MPVAEERIEIDVAPDRVMALICDFASYPRFLPQMHEATVLRAEPDCWVVRFGVVVVRRLEYTLRLHKTSPLQLSWSLVEGAFRSNDGGWVLEPLDEGRRTRATYCIDLDVGMFIPKSVLNTIVGNSLPATLAAFKREAEARG
jgi:ribosome-associated toxin RatA of RatAB toxin-antitoxin module